MKNYFSALTQHSSPSTLFLLERVSALALIPLMIWFCLSLAFLPEASYESVISWLRSPFNSTMMGLIIVIGFKHGQLGIQMIIEDYVATPSKQRLSLFAVQVISYTFIIVGIYSIIKIALLDPSLTLTGGH